MGLILKVIVLATWLGNSIAKAIIRNEMCDEGNNKWFRWRRYVLKNVRE